MVATQSIVDNSPPLTGAVSEAEPRPIRWTTDQFQQLGDTGMFDGLHVELIEGEILEISPMLSLHATGVTIVGDTLRLAFGTGYFVRTQLPLHLGSRSEPEPDVAVLRGVPADFRAAHPVSAELIIEVSDTTLRFDRLQKASLYARAAIQEYWILNLNESQLEVHRQPVAMPAQPYGHGYAEVTIFTSTDSITPLAAPQAAVAVADLLP